MSQQRVPHPSILCFALCLLIVLSHCAPARAQGYVCAEGGGSLGRAEWASPVFAWMIEKGQRGVVAVLGAPVEPESAPEPGSATAPASAPDRLLERFKNAGAAGVLDLRIGPDNADKQETFDAITSATVIFMRGGDQSKYVRAWKGTKTEAAIREVFKRGGVVGGTSAGCAVLGEVVYDAFHGSATSRETLQNARNPDVSLTTGFIECAPGVIFDTHFTERGRLGRFAVMLAMTRADLKRDVIGIGMDTRTAFCISPEGTAEVLGQGSATVLMLTPESRIELIAGQPPVVTDVVYSQLLPGARFDVKARKVLECGPHAAATAPPSPDAAAKRALPQGVRLHGGAAADSRLGAVFPDDSGDAEALWHGRLKLGEGEGKLPACVVEAAAFDQREFLENRVGGVQWALAQRPGSLGIYLTTGVDLQTASPATLMINPPATGPASSAILLDLAAAHCFGAGTSRVAEQSTGPRQSAGMVDARLHVLSAAWTYDARTGEAIVPKPDPPSAAPAQPMPR